MSDELAINERETVLARCEEKLREATERFAHSDREYRTASSNRSVALNNLNEAQKALDAAIGRYRSSAPPESDWKQRHNGRCEGV